MARLLDLFSIVAIAAGGDIAWRLVECSRLARAREAARARAGGIDFATTEAKVVNHIIPLAHGGSDDDDNTENLCGSCDKAVTAEQFGHRQRVEIGADGWPL